VRPTGKRRTVEFEHAAVRLAFDTYIEERRATLGTRPSGRPLQRVLGEYILFSRRSGPAAPMSDQGVHNWWRRMLSNAGAPDYSMPDARRTAEQQTGQRYVSEDVASLRALTGQIRSACPRVRRGVDLVPRSRSAASSHRVPADSRDPRTARGSLVEGRPRRQPGDQEAGCQGPHYQEGGRLRLRDGSRVFGRQPQHGSP
jgi:hypothetical protein